jgi:PKD repeat protein
MAGQAVQFTDTSTGTPTSRSWSFGDGSTSTLQNPTHTYTTAGSKTVTLTVTNASGSNSTSRTMTVATALTASFSYSPTSPAAGQSVQFTDASVGTPTSWSWSFGDGSTSALQNPAHVYTTAGSKTVTLTATNASGSNSTSRTVTVLAALAASFTCSPASPAAGQSVQFTDTSIGTPSIWQWNFGDGATSVAQHPVHAFASAGSYVVALTVMSGSTSNSTSRTMTVGATLTASFSYSPTSPAAGQSVQFTDASVGTPTSWSWSFGDGSTSTLQNPTHTYTTAGSKSVTLTVTNASGSNNTSRTVSVATALTASFTYSPTSPSAGQSVQFTDTSTGTPTSRSWSFGDGSASTLQNPTHTYTTAGSKTVTLTVTNATGSNSTSRTVTVATALTASFTYSPTSPSAGQAVQFADTSTGTPTSWTWSFGDGGASTAQNPSHTYSAAGSYTVSLTSTNSSGTNSASRALAVSPASVVDASFSFTPSSPSPGQAVAFTDTSAGTPTSWQWDFGDGGTSVAQNPSHTFTGEGSYSVILIAGSTSGSDTASRTVTVATSSDIIPEDRIYDWGTHSGVPGGIPNRTTVYRTLTAANTLAEINAAIQACPSGQVVYLSAGTYSLSGITRKSGVTVRGAGAGQTVISSGGSTAFNSIGGSFNYDGGHQSIANGTWLAKGSTSVTLSSAPGSQFVVGRLIMINQNDDHTLVFPRTGNWAGTRNLRHVSRITGISGNTITFSTPLPYTFVYAQSPGAQAIAANDSQFGIEDMTIDAVSCVRFQGSDRCWIENCELRGFGNEAVFMRDSHQLEVRRCYIHDADGFPNQSDGYGVYSQYAVSNILVEDCIGYRMAYMTVMNGNDSSAFLYNYIWQMGRAGFPWQNPGLNCNHGPHSIMNLWEGNMTERWQNDAYHGSASHQTLFRNHIHGKHPTYTLDRRIMDFCRTSYYYNAVGNIVGDSSWNPTYFQASKQTGTGYYTGGLDRAQGYLWVLGYPNMGSGSLTAETTLTGFTPPGGTYPDSNVLATLIRHGNYDYYNKGVVWDNSISSHTVPDSLMHTSKPAFFGTLQWPPIGPDVAGLVTPIPAQARWNAYQSSGVLSDLFRNY